MVIWVVLLSVFTVIFLILLIKLYLENKKLKSKYSSIIDIDTEFLKLQKESEKLDGSMQKLRKQYEAALAVKNGLEKQINLYRDDLEIADYGIYEPHYGFDTSEKFKGQINKVREQQKQLIKEKRAALGGEGITWNNSVAKGKVIVNREKKLMLRAFNGEADNFIGSVAWNNVKRMEERLSKSVEAINTTGKEKGISISGNYFDLKMKELRLTHEYRVKKQEEKEEQRRIREQMREEEKARKDFEKAQAEAEKQEKLLKQAMQKAQEQIAKATEEERARYEEEIAKLEIQLKEAEEKGQKAISMAQQTKSGHVYVISNIGSFGENIYKIGMTRRLEPLDRVNELGDASVPFKFDVHAMIYSDNAPELENALHKNFSRYRVNLVNTRREYFHVSLEDIQKVVMENHGSFEFVIEPEAQEYRESLIIRNADLQATTKEDEFPSVEELFS